MRMTCISPWLFSLFKHKAFNEIYEIGGNGKRLSDAKEYVRYLSVIIC